MHIIFSRFFLFLAQKFLLVFLLSFNNTVYVFELKRVYQVCMHEKLITKNTFTHHTRNIMLTKRIYIQYNKKITHTHTYKHISKKEQQ